MVGSTSNLDCLLLEVLGFQRSKVESMRAETLVVLSKPWK